jgi:hypothetical protein
LIKKHEKHSKVFLKFCLSNFVRVNSDENWQLKSLANSTKKIKPLTFPDKQIVPINFNYENGTLKSISNETNKIGHV